MRIRGTIISLSVVLNMLMTMMLMMTTPVTGYRPVKSHHHQSKRMAGGPTNLYADFATINSDDRSAVAVNQQCNLVGADGHGVANDCNSNDQPKTKCDVKQIFSSGDPKQKSSSIAIKAAQDAKAASEAQAAAGLAAAQHIKQELADKAFQSAKAAEAALTGKQMVVDQLEQEMNEASAVVDEESASLQSTEINMNAAVDAARAATQQFEALTVLQKNAQDNLSNIQTVAMGSQQEMASKTQLLEAAKNRVLMLQKQLQNAREDFEKTKQAAYKAACAAVEAKQKVTSNTFFRQRRRNQQRGESRYQLGKNRLGS